MLTKEDLLAIAELMDERIKPVNERLDRLEEQVAAVDRKATDTRILIETEIGRAIKILGEGHQGILETMKGQVTQDQHEKLKDRVFALEEGMKEHKEQIRELKRKTG